MPTHLLLKGSTLWALNGLADPPESGLSLLKSANAVAIEVSEPTLRQEAVEEAIMASRLGLIIQAYPLQATDFDETLQLAKTHQAKAVNLQVRLPHADQTVAAQFARELILRAADENVAVYFETHRGCLTQDLYRAVKLLEAVPEMRLTLDASHYVLAEGQCGVTDSLWPLLDPLLDRVEMIHGRISNGQQIQMSVINPDGEIEQSFQHLWTEAMRRWRRRKPAGSTLIFTPELGPPPYAIVTPDGRELSNRMEQSEITWQIAQAAWKQSAR